MVILMNACILKGVFFNSSQCGSFSIQERVQLQYTLLSSKLLRGKASDSMNHCLWSLLSLHTEEGLPGPSKENSAEHCLNVYRD